MPVTIRPMTAGDKPAIMSILGSTLEFVPSDIEVAEELIDGYLQLGEESGYYVLVAEDDHAISGYICYGPNPLTVRTWDIYWIAVDQYKQGKGIGKALISTAEDEVRKANARMIFIETSGQPLYEKTRQFYLSRGYKVVCRITDFYDIGDAKVILQKRLE